MRTVPSGSRWVGLEPHARGRAGYSLLAALWLCLGIGALGASVATETLKAMRASANRTAMLQALWHARGCMSAAEAAAHRAFQRSYLLGERRAMDWIRLDRIVTVAPESTGLPCVVTARAVGTRPDVNTAGRELLFEALIEGGTAPARADSLTAALMDWIDPDTVVRALGAERSWYRDARRPTPLDGPVADVRALTLVRGLWDDAPELGLLDVEAGAVSLHDAPVTEPRELPRLDPSPGSGARRAVPGAAVEPEAWILTAVGSSDRGGASVAVEWRVTRIAGTIVLRRQRMWVQ